MTTIAKALRNRAFFRGAAKILDIYGQHDRDALLKEIRSRSVQEAIGRDWVKVAGDLRRAMKKFELEQE